ncbi:hypothetical protein [Maribacter sp. R77961]|uniref:hypothetical protein n=1 Tax=Maribacter sp. R77961 TaxID=3093871 RepID=UPI0037C6EAFA
MINLKKATLSSVLLFLIPFLLLAQGKTLPIGAKQKIVINKIENNPAQAYSSTIDLNDSRLQLIMAGQNYQTNYGIYASIEVAESTMGSDYKTLKKVNFEIVNYKPTYFIGIDSIIVSATRALDGLTFKIYTRALSDKNTYSLNEDVLRNIHFEKDSYLHSERILNPMFPELDANGKPVLMRDGRMACKPDNGKAFDFEFFYKDAYLVVRKEDYDRRTEEAQLYKNEEAFAMPGRRCKESYNKVVF